MKIALAQMDIIWMESSANQKKITEFVEEAAEREVSLVLFPEMSLTGFTMEVDSFNDSEDDILAWLKELAIKNNINIGLGYAFKADERGKNKYSIISKEGEILVNYTKIHPFSMAGEDNYYYSGDSILFSNIDDLNISSFICYDLRFPYLFQTASEKAELITVAANWPESRRDHWVTLLRARAIENQCFIAGVNRVGEGNGLIYSGDSMVLNPNGDLIVCSSYKEELLICEIDLKQIEESRSKMNIIKDRKIITKL